LAAWSGSPIAANRSGAASKIAGRSSEVIIDVSTSAARALGIVSAGVVEVLIE